MTGEAGKHNGVHGTSAGGAPFAGKERDARGYGGVPFAGKERVGRRYGGVPSAAMEGLMVWGGGASR